jgi:hypothetical protein
MGKQRFAREEAYEVADAVMKLVAVAARHGESGYTGIRRLAVKTTCGPIC